MRGWKLGLAVIAVAALPACSGMSSADKGAIAGAAIGGIGGSALTGGSALGTVGGAAAGGIIGHEVGKDRDRR